MTRNRASAGSVLSGEIRLFIDLNIQQVPRAVGLDVPPAAAASILGITEAQFRAYIASVQADVRQMAAELLSQPQAAEAIDRLPVPPGGALMAVGDSITTHRRGYVQILRAMLDLRRPDDAVRVLNMGESGYTSTMGREIAYTLCVAQQPDLVLVMLGVNDCKRFGPTPKRTLVSIQEYGENMAAIVQAFSEHTSARLVLLTPTPIPEDVVNSYPDFVSMRMRFSNDDIRARAEVVRSLARSLGLPLVDLVTLFGGEPDPSLYSPEGLHPAPQGHRLIVREILKTLS